MNRLKAVAATCAVLLAVPAGARAASNPFLNEQASPIPAADQGSNANYRSFVTHVTPSVPGLQVQVLAFADRLQLFNHTGKTVTIYGYQNEPYARLLPNGTVQLNERSPAVYLNTSFYGNDVAVPASANPSAAPQWATVFKTGNFQWHDHRIHWASPQTPPQVKNKGQRTLIFNWTVPISVGAQPGAIAGQLYWQPGTSKASPLAYILLALVVVLGVALVVVVRRRRAGGPSGPDAREAAEHPAAKEAW